MTYSWPLFWRFYALAILVTVVVMAAVALGGHAAVLTEFWVYLEREQTYPNVFSIAHFGLSENPAAFLILLFAAAPTLAALFFAARAGSASLANLMARMRPVGPEYTRAPVKRVYALLFLSYALILAVYLAVTGAHGGTEALSLTLDKLGNSWPLILALCAIAPFMDEGGLLEELGWRGFAWPALQALLSSPLKAALLLGTLWWAWHLPRDLPGLLAGADPGTFLLQQSLFLLLCLAESIICGYLVNLCGGSVLPAILVHGGSNVWSKAASTEMYALTGIDVRTAILVVAALAILALCGRALGRQTPP
ncbi:MAG: CPBP family intramembrane glutamic endopeptidase [Pseudomonadota bacterium]